jgi:hypothetical protein
MPGTDHFVTFTAAAVPDRLHLRPMDLDATLQRVADADGADCPAPAAGAAGGDRRP